MVCLGRPYNLLSGLLPGFKKLNIRGTILKLTATNLNAVLMFVQ